jgi:Na+/H+ antiporter NhaD/arsenite permease-like protein
MNYVTGPLIAVLFLLAILAIGRKEVHDGTLGFGADSISPIAIIAVFMTLAYITLSINVSGITRYSALKVLQREGGVGHRLFFYVYTFLFGIGSFIGNDFIILSGTAFLAYFTRCLTNIMHPRAWIYTQFAITKIASAILVSSNPTNLILTSAFNIKFIHYAANMIVPVVATVIVLFPCLLYIIFADENLIPLSIRMHELFEGARGRQPVSPNIPNARGIAGGENNIVDRFEEDMNPFLDKVGAAFGAIIVAAMLVTLLAVNGASQSASEYPVYWVTLPAAFVLFCWDIASGWYCRKETREIARKRREEIERFRDEITIQIPIREGERANGEEEESRRTAPEQGGRDTRVLPSHVPTFFVSENVGDLILSSSSPGEEMNGKQDVHEEKREVDEEQEMQRREKLSREMALRQGRRNGKGPRKSTGRRKGRERRKSRERRERRERRESMEPRERKGRNTTLVSLLTELHWWCQGTFPTATFVVTQLPFALAPFALSMFVLDQALITKGWAALLAYGWDHWVKSTGTVGAVGGMGFLSVILCNVSFSFGILRHHQLTSCQ